MVYEPPNENVRTDTEREVVVSRTGSSTGSILLAVVLGVLALLLVIWLFAAGDPDPDNGGAVVPGDTETTQVETTAPVDSTAPVETSAPTETTVAP